MTVRVAKRVHVFEPDPKEWRPIYRVGVSTDPSIQSLREVINPLVEAVIQLQVRVDELEALSVRAPKSS